MMETNYKLVQSVDPTKCRRPKIREKFAKLTLSSNKKRPQDEENLQNIRMQSNVSRNLLSELLTSDESDGEKQQPSAVNLLTRTDSSTSDSNNASKNVALDTTHCSEVERDAEKSMEMEALLVSGLENTEMELEIDKAIEKLSSCVSLMAMGEVPAGGQRLSDLLKCKKEVDNSICISSSSESSNTPITISDSSEGECEYEANVSPLPQNLPAMLDSAKTDRMAAFLRDVRLNQGLPPISMSQDSDIERRQKEIATADTELNTVDNDSRSMDTARRIATADTESMTHEGGTTKMGSVPETEPANLSNSRRLALNDTVDMTKTSEESMQSSPRYVPVMKFGTEFDESIHKSCASLPEDSLTIAETSDEDETTPQKETQSNTLSQLKPKESSVSSEYDTQFKINISAKINIKIQVSQTMEESTTSEDSEHSQPKDKSETDSADEKPTSSAQKANCQTNALENVPSHSPPERDTQEPPVNKSPDFMQKAHCILTELYGNNWKTPEVMRSLKKAVREPEKSKAETTENSFGDFSIFRRNIPQNLDSTRLPSTPVSIFKTPHAKGSFRRPRVNHESIAKKTLQDECKKTKTGREVDSDTESEGENASRDSDKSWIMSDDANVENKKPPTKKKQRNTSRSKKSEDIVYLDLSKGEVEVQHNVSASPPANHDEKFNRRLEDILRSCKFEDKAQIECTPGGRTKRKLFTANLMEDNDIIVAPLDSPKDQLKNIDKDGEKVSLSGVPMPAKFEPFNKYLESVKTGQPIFKIQTPNAKPSPSVLRTPKSVSKEPRVIDELCATPKDKYGFLKSLDLCVGKSLCHPDALYYRDNFRLRRDDLANKLYNIYNKRCFDEVLDVPIKWNKKLTNTAGRCMNKKKLGERTCVIELSEKVVTSADRLRCTLIHELCHAATWVLNGEGGHGATWKAWARKANQVFPELPKIGVCHQYDIEYKYTYKCTLCAAKSHAHSKSKKVENIRCSYCHGAIEVYLNKKDKEGNTIATPVREPTGFAKFVKDKYKEYKRPDLKHADVMKVLSNQFASMKVDGKT